QQWFSVRLLQNGLLVWLQWPQEIPRFPVILQLRPDQLQAVQSLLSLQVAVQELMSLGPLQLQLQHPYFQQQQQLAQIPAPEYFAKSQSLLVQDNQYRLPESIEYDRKYCPEPDG